MICPGSVRMSEGIADTTSEYAAEGTRAHDLAHYLLDPVNAPLADPDDEDMLNHVEAYVEYVQGLAGYQKYEVRCDFSKWVPGGYGTADAVVFDDITNTLHVIDLKYGKGDVVSPVENVQATLYALGAWYGFSLVHDIENIELHIVQPRLNHFRSWSMTVEELVQFSAYATDRYQATIADDAPLVPDEKACKYCRARGTCRALADVNMQTAQLIFGPVEEEDEVQEMPDINKLTVVEQAYIYKHRGMISSMMSAIEQSLSRELSHGREVPGYKLVIGRSKRAWKDADAAEQALRKVNKLKVRDIFKTSLISPTQAEKLLGKGHALIEKFVTKPEGKPTIVESSDKRKEVNTLIETFEAVKTL
jgi:hypothetical protein